MINLLAILGFIGSAVIARLEIPDIKVIEFLPAAKILDWKVKPYVSIELVDHYKECPEGTYDIFNRTWHGT